MITLGYYSLLIALLLTTWAFAGSIAGHLNRSAGLVRSAERAMLGTLFTLTVSVVGLEYALLTDQFHIRYVATHSSAAMPTIYKITALWGGQAGSLLLWVWLLAGYSALALYLKRSESRGLTPYANAALSASILFFLVLLNFVDGAQPFVGMPFTPADGQGLNPQLQTPLMAIHPPLLYLGFVGFAVPYAFGVAALMTGKLDDRWIRLTRRWTLTAWSFLGVGILLGSYWAYVELGWGGYWAWDPVENASFMPWLLGTAFLHSVMIQEKKRMLKIWNVSLVLGTYIMCIFGTFLTRSGLISSVHAFAQSDIGAWFMGFVGILLLSAVYLVLLRLPELRSHNHLESVISRESSFLLNNLLFVVATFAILWGTLFPKIAEAVQGSTITVGPPWFNAIAVPIFLAVVFLSGVGPLLAWRKATVDRLLRVFAVPTGVGLASAALLALFGLRDGYALVSFALALFVIATVTQEFHRGARARSQIIGSGYLTGLRSLIGRNHRRYGGYVVHVGIVLIMVGIAGSSIFQKEVTALLMPGETLEIGPYTVRFVDHGQDQDAHKQTLWADLEVSRGDDRLVGVMRPERNFYLASEMATSEVDIRSTLAEDLYLVLIGSDPRTGQTSFRAYLNPLVNWMWLGGLVALLGVVVAALPERRVQRVVVAQVSGPREGAVA